MAYHIFYNLKGKKFLRKTRHAMKSFVENSCEIEKEIVLGLFESKRHYNIELY